MITTEKIWFEYHNKLSEFIRKRVSENVTDDLLQDVFVKIHTRIDSLRENTKLESWIFQITRNTIIDYYRSKKPREELPEWIKQPDSHEEESIRKEISSCLEPMIRQLPDKYRNAIRLSEIERKTQKEVSRIENISLSGAKSRVQRGRSLLRSMLFDCCQIERDRDNRPVSYEKKEQDCKSC